MLEYSYRYITSVLEDARLYANHARYVTVPTVSVADPDPGSDAFLTPGPGSGIGFFRIPDLGSRIPTP
jgi:hypothetical protein